MGHVARCIPLINKLKNNNNKIWIAASLSQQNVFKAYFPELHYLPLLDYPFKFSEKRSFVKSMIISAISLCSRLIKEKRKVDEWQRLHNFDCTAKIAQRSRSKPQNIDRIASKSTPRIKKRIRESNKQIRGSKQWSADQKHIRESRRAAETIRGSKLHICIDFLCIFAQGEQIRGSKLGTQKDPRIKTRIPQTSADQSPYPKKIRVSRRVSPMLHSKGCTTTMTALRHCLWSTRRCHC